MSISCSFRFLAVALPGMFLLIGQPGRAAAPIGTDQDKQKVDSPAEQVRKALEKTVTLDIANQSLSLALSRLNEQTKIKFDVDRAALMQYTGMEPDQFPVTAKLRDVKAKTALRSVCKQLNLASVIIGDSVVITREDLATARQLRQRVSLDYDKVPLAAALKQLSKETATNLLLDSRLQKEAQHPITLQLEDVPLDTAVRLIAELGGMKPVRIGNVLFVTGKANAVEMRSDPELVPQQVDGLGQIGQAGNAPPGIGWGAVVPLPAPAVQAVPVMPDQPPPPPADGDRPVQAMPEGRPANVPNTAPAAPPPTGKPVPPQR